MLRHKLLARIGLLIGGFLAGAVVAVVLLQRVVHQVQLVNSEAELLTTALHDLGDTIMAAEGMAAGAPRPPALEVTLGWLGGHRLVREGSPAAPAFERLAVELPRYVADPGSSAALAHELRAELRDLEGYAGAYSAARRTQLADSFRRLVFALTVAAIAMVNVAVVVLLRTAHMILRPVDELVAASRELAGENFGYRVVVDRDDEFGELAHAYNHLAEQLGANEQRKMDTLRQVAVTLNHDLNNAISVIELQLRLLDRHSDDPALKDRLGRIHTSLARVAAAVHALAKVRRIVLTEYMPGQLMIDLKRSVDEEPPHAAQKKAATA